jgi:hypothetical protein
MYLSNVLDDVGDHATLKATRTLNCQSRLKLSRAQRSGDFSCNGIYSSFSFLVVSKRRDRVETSSKVLTSRCLPLSNEDVEEGIRA